VRCILYDKSLFTENTVATPKHSSASINTNKAKTTTKSITVVDTWYWSIILFGEYFGSVSPLRVHHILIIFCLKLCLPLPATNQDGLIGSSHSNNILINRSRCVDSLFIKSATRLFAALVFTRATLC